jgi:hypothetical protein
MHRVASASSRALSTLRGVCFSITLLCVPLACARAAEANVPYVPTPQAVVERMLEIAKVGPQDYLIDLGSGDGRIVVTAARKYGAHGFGVDLNPTRIAEAEENAQRAQVSDKVAFYQRDLFQTDLSQASVITMYLLPRVNLELRPALLELKAGTRIVSHDFSMGDWQPELHEQVDAPDKYGGSGGRSDIYLWIVPAKVGGSWQSELQVRGKPVRYEIDIQQHFQELTGSARVGGRAASIQNATVKGDQVTLEFTAEIDGVPIRHQFSGKVAGTSIDGTADLSGARLQSRMDWAAKLNGRSRQSTGAVQTRRMVSAARH